MKQLLQNAGTGDVAVAEVPVPQLLAGCVLVRIGASVVSAGTERASSQFASKNLLQKAQARPDLVRDVLTKLRRDGVISTLNAVRGRLDQPLALGYSSAGTVIAVGEGVTDISVGDAVACAGAGYAVHAEVACIPRLLLARNPNPIKISCDEAAFSTLGAVALHGVRTSEAALGDTVAVIGLGLLGQLTVQILKAAGCRVIGFDLNRARADLAVKFGADAASDHAATFRDLCIQQTRERGVDAVVITAETPSSDPVNLAGAVARDRAIVVAVGTVGMDIERKSYYGKELDFRLSRSYGPGRYDTAFEQKGRDYPLGYVRWTETRNMEAFLGLLAAGKVDVRSMITHRFPIGRAPEAYDLITGQAGEPSLGVLITYPESGELRSRVDLAPPPSQPTSNISLGVIGAGNFAMSTLLPAIRGIAGISLAGVCTATSSHSRHAAEKFGFRYCTSDAGEILRDDSINTVLIATRHQLHAAQVLAALAAGKHVFCEKPLCLTETELAAIVRAGRHPNQRAALMVGFNRRFAPLAMKMKKFFSDVREPLLMHYRVNAGTLPADHWTRDPEQGGGRILGEVCHFVDFLSFISGARPVEVSAHSLAGDSAPNDENLSISLRFANGSQGTITYAANGDRAFSKERIEVFGGGAAAVLEDYRSLELVRHGRGRIERSRLRQDKGHRGEWGAFVATLKSAGTSPIPFDDLIATTLATIRILESRNSGMPMQVNVEEFLSASLQPSLESEAGR